MLCCWRVDVVGGDVGAAVDVAAFCSVVDVVA